MAIPLIKKIDEVPDTMRMALGNSVARINTWIQMFNQEYEMIAPGPFRKINAVHRANLRFTLIYKKDDETAWKKE